MAQTPTTKSELLKSHAKELVKMYVALDGQGRPEYVYTAYTDAVQGSPCQVTQYVYAGPTSTVIIGRKEGYAFWDTSWVPDSAFTVSA